MQEQKQAQTEENMHTHARGDDPRPLGHLAAKHALGAFGLPQPRLPFPIIGWPGAAVRECMVVLSFMGLIFYCAGTQLSSMGYAMAPVAVGFAAFIMIIEAFVAFVQAYVFTILSAIFVGASLHPEH